MATTVNFGKCEKCGQNNPMSLSVCRYCGKALPWAKPKAAKPKSDGGFKLSSTPSIDWGYWGVAVFSFLIPLIGFFLYRSYSNEGSEKAGAAGIGALLGVLFTLRASRSMLRQVTNLNI